MIVDSSENAPWYFPHAWWSAAFAFVRSVVPDTPDGRYPVPGSAVIAQIFTTKTRGRESCRLESHRLHADIQFVLQGEEVVGIWPASELTANTSYDAQRDVIFYDPPVGPPMTFHLAPGRFALYLPQDAHMTQIAPQGKEDQLRKVVLKVPIELLTV